MRELSSQINKSLKVASSTVRFGGRTVKVCGNTIKKTIHAPAEAKKNIKLLKAKFRSLQKATAKGKLKKAVGVVGKTATKSAALTVKAGSKVISSAGNAIGKVDNDDIRLAKKSVDAARTTVSGAKTVSKAAVSGAKFTGRTIKTSAKTVRTLATKKGRRALATSVNRKVNRIKRNVKQTKAATKKTAKAAKSVTKIVVKVVGKVVNLIISTAPWSFIIIGAILLIIIASSMIAQFATSAAGTVAGGGAWLVDDLSSQTPEQIYDGYNDYKALADEVIQSKVKEKLEDEVTAFCNSDTTEPRKIIQFNDRTFYPASGKNSTINSIIEKFKVDDYSDYMSLLFVLMTREKQRADGVTDAEIYDFDFTKADFEEFVKTVDDNTCRWGETFLYKITTETTGNACPGENCKKKKTPGCKCAVDENGNKYCAGHPYCPHNHTKLTVKLYTVKDYHNKGGSNLNYSEIYNFTENEKIRFETSKGFVKSLLDYWEGGE